ncbi:Cation-transporting P-type ATPase [Carpediemonas membranifera]|uniref:Cation-transporting P-type ATPase n=1 Tax=Carpediemonas membranifera TaxID=201153 RepID=A0A8J6ATG9_9EUKA|nr:Cation-transporting P-type ATPase [Carpediemonas membranifera]|eukprot:KAG9394171.1 Cation-transporting P-type ATPase [Carpediemonas membranifera]
MAEPGAGTKRVGQYVGQSKRIDHIALLKKKNILVRFDLFIFLLTYAAMAYFFVVLLMDGLEHRLSPDDLLALLAKEETDAVEVDAGVSFEAADDDLLLDRSVGPTQLLVLDPAFHKLFMFIIGSVIIVAIHTCILLLEYWNLNVRRRMVFTQCSMDKATHVFLKPSATNGNTCIIPFDSTKSAFEWKRRIFTYSKKKDAFVKRAYPTGKHISEYASSMTTGLTRKQVKDGQTRYGGNTLDIPLPTFAELYKEHAVAPFFVFQIFCCLLWIMDDYGVFSFFTLAMLVGMEGVTVMQRIKTMREIRTMVPSPIQVFVKREGVWSSVPSDKLVPGDIVSVAARSKPVTRRASKKAGKTEKTIVFADILALDGTAVLDEASLTGESIPQLREPWRGDETLDSLKKFKTSVLFAGTNVMQVESASDPAPDRGMVGYVLRTGFETAQGKLVRAIGWDTDRLTGNFWDSLIFITALLIVAIIAAVYTFRRGMEGKVASSPKLLLTSLLIITSVVPPDLPMQLALAVNTAMSGLRKKGIYCTESFRIPLAGALTAACFDKTGTITTDTLELVGVVTEPNTRVIKPVDTLPQSSPARTVLAGCHTLFRADGELNGDPMEVAAFKAMKGTLSGAVATIGKTRVEVQHRFQFNSTLKRMTVGARVDNQQMTLTKGAPEVLKTLFRKIPSGYDDAVRALASEGFRVIALAHSSGKVDKNKERAAVEKDLVFAGLALFRAPVRPEAAEMVRQLTGSCHKVILITGDNLLTCLSVAGEVGLTGKPVLTLTAVSESFASFVDEYGAVLEVTAGTVKKFAQEYIFAAEGAIVGELLASPAALRTAIVPRITAFARTSPDNKASIIATLQEAGHSTLMTGDGTNDVGALKRADVGVAIVNKHMTEAALEDARKKKAVLDERMKNAPAFLAKRLEAMQQATEDMAGEVQLGDASIAAPFTLRRGGLTAVLEVCRQGRATLMLTVMMYKTLALECLVQAYSLSVLTLDGVRFSTPQMIAKQFFQTALMMSQTKIEPLQTLSPRRAPRRAVTLPTVVSTVGQGAVHMGVMFLSARFARAYVGPPKTFALDHEFEPGLVNTVVFLSDCVISVSTAFSNYVGNPFMVSLWKNKKVRNILLAAAFGLFILISQSQPELNKLLEMVEIPEALISKLTVLYVADVIITKSLDVACSRFLGSKMDE